jgi:hypothetical protein
MKERMHLRIVAWLVLGASASAAVPQTPAAGALPAAPVYVFMPNTSADGGGAPNIRFGDFVMFQIYPQLPQTDGERRPDAATIYQRGKRVSAYVDGERRGEVRIEEVRDYHCNSSVALIAPSLGRISKSAWGLATNAPGIESRSPGRRNATSSERALAIRLANQEFRRNGVPASLLSRIRETSLFAIEVDATKQKTLVGSFYVQNDKERHDVFVIAPISGTVLSLEYSRYGTTTDLNDFKDHQSIGLFDHLDMNRDGSDEIVLGVGGYESERYEIYSRQNGKWELLSTSEEAGC